MPRKFEPNDILMLSDFYSLDLGENFFTQKLYTSEQIKVISTEIVDIPINLLSDLKLSCDYDLKIIKQTKAFIDAFNKEYSKIHFKCWLLRVVKLSEKTDQTLKILVIDDEDYQSYNKIKNDTAICIKNFITNIQSLNKTVKSITKLIAKPLWKQWNSIYVNPFASVNYGYSITCHKSQGSSFFDVFIDLDDILSNNKQIEAKKCAYTAATRTINELNILI